MDEESEELYNLYSLLNVLRVMKRVGMKMDELRSTYWRQGKRKENFKSRKTLSEKTT